AELLEFDRAEPEAGQGRTEAVEVGRALRTDLEQDAASKIDAVLKALRHERHGRDQKNEQRQRERGRAELEEVELGAGRYQGKRHEFLKAAVSWAARVAARRQPGVASPSSQ